MKLILSVLLLSVSFSWADGVYCAVRGEKKTCIFDSKWDCEDARLGSCVFNTESYTPNQGNMRLAQTKINDAGGLLLAQIAIGIGTVLLAPRFGDRHSSLTVYTVGGIASTVCGVAAGWNLYTLKF